MTSKFRSNVWDPLLIISQIIAMQCQFYFTLAIILFLTSNMFLLSSQYSLDILFNFNYLSFKFNSTFCFLFLVNSLISAVFEWYLITRTKKCLDFTLTVHMYHVLICWLYSGQFPNTFSYWLIITLSSLFMTLLSEYLCLKSELKEIPLALVPKANL